MAKILLFLTFLSLSPPATQEIASYGDSKYFVANKVLDEFYNHYDSVEKNIEARELVLKLLQDYGSDPYFYDLWAFIELITISHELGIKIDEQKDLSNLTAFSERVQNYHRIVDAGFALTEGKSDSKSQFLRASLLFAKARFNAKFGGGLSGLQKADRDSADGIKIAAKVVLEDKDFCLANLFFGITSFGLAAKTEPWSLNRLYVRARSKAYNALYGLNNDVFNKSNSLKILEDVYIYSCSRYEMWAHKFWLESAFFLSGAYQNYRKELKISEELKILEEKELPLLWRLNSLFPSNLDVAKKLELANLRARILKNYLTKKDI